MRILLTLIVIINIISCGDDGPNCPGDISLPVEIHPDRPFFSIGDTILISSIFHKNLYDHKTNTYLDVTRFSFTPLISFFALDSTYEYNVLSNIDQFGDIIDSIGSQIHISYAGKESSIVGEFKVKKDSMQFSIKLRLKKKGFFWLRTESLSSGDGHLQNNYNFGCRGREVTFKLVSPKESNIQILQEFRSIKSNDWILQDSINRFYNHAGYCFEVK